MVDSKMWRATMFPLFIRNAPKRGFWAGGEPSSINRQTALPTVPAGRRLAERSVHPRPQTQGLHLHQLVDAQPPVALAVGGKRIFRSDVERLQLHQRVDRQAAVPNAVETGDEIGRDPERPKLDEVVRREVGVAG